MIIALVFNRPKYPVVFSSSSIAAVNSSFFTVLMGKKKVYLA